MSLRALTIVSLLAASAAALASSCSSNSCSSDSDCGPGEICASTKVCLKAQSPDALGGDGSGGDVPTVSCPAPLPGQLVLNEILADPGSAIDANGDGVQSSSDDEFVEIVNLSSTEVSLQGVDLQVKGESRHVFGAVCLRPFQAALVFAGGDVKDRPFFQGALVRRSSRKLGLTNSGGTVALVLGGKALDNMTYGSEGGKEQSLTRSPDLTGGWILHSRAAGAVGSTFSPGACVDGSAFPDCPGAAPTDATGDGDGPADIPADAPPACPSPAPGDLIINEVLADPGDLDANGDGKSSSSEDEFVEVVNVSDAVLNLGGLELRTKGDTKHSYAPECLMPGQAVVVFGGGTPGGAEAFGGSLARVSDRSLVLTNSGATVALVRGGVTLDSMTYGSEGSGKQSLTRDPDLVGTAFVRHSEAKASGGSRMSPGTCASGAPFPSCPTGPPPTDAGGDANTGGDAGGDPGQTSDPGMADTGPACDPPLPGDLVINEILADPPTGADPNGDGNPSSTQDEFIEIVVRANRLVSLAGTRLRIKGADKHSFASVCLGPGEAVVVFSGGSPDTEAFGGVRVVTSTHTLVLSNGGATVELVGAGGVVLDAHTYGSEGGADQSLTRSPDVGGDFVKHSEAAGANGALMSPGRCVGGGFFPACVVN